MKVLLVNPPWKRFFGESTVITPLALANLCTYIRAKQPAIHLDLFDADLDLSLTHGRHHQYDYALQHETYLKRLNDNNDVIWRDIRNTLEEHNPDVVGVSVMTATYSSSMKIASMAKDVNPQTKVIFGGRHVSAIPNYVLRKNNNVDFAILGEGEETLKELLERIDEPEAVRGVAYRSKGGAIVVNQARPYISDLNSTPTPVYESSISRYGYESGGMKNPPSWSIVGARGCPFKCTYCASEAKVRVRSPEHIMQEVDYVLSNYGIQNLRFDDDSFSFSPNRTKELCSQLAERNVRWECNTRVDMISPDTVQNMKESGCARISFGIESGSERTLSLINKKITLDKVQAAVAMVKDARIKVNGYFIVGFPWETRNDMQNTIMFAESLSLNNYEVNFATPLPGTAFFEDLQRRGKIDIETLDWNDFHQASPMMNYSSRSDKAWVKDILYIQKLTSVLGHVRRWRRKLHLLSNPLELWERLSDEMLKR